MKGFEESGNARTGVLLHFSLSFLKGSSHSSVHCTYCLFLDAFSPAVRGFKGQAIYTNLYINHLQWLITPKKLHTSVLVVGVGQFLMAVIFLGSVSMLSTETM